MDPNTPKAPVVRFGVFELDARSGELRRHGLKIRLPDQSFQILRLLLSRPGSVVTRDELHRALWTSDTFVDFDVGLNSAVRKLREALDDSAENPRFVETLPRRGYRFIAPVNVATEDLPLIAGDGTSAPGSAARAGWIACGVFLIATLVAMGVLHQRGGLARLRAGTAAPIRSLAVLPFDNLTGDAAQDYFVDAVTDALTTHLAQVEGLEVISRTSAKHYKEPVKRISAIGNELKIDAVVEGSVVRSGERVSISAQLVRTATDRHVWAQTYDRELSHIIPLQQQIASDIAAAIGRPPRPLRAAARGQQTVDPKAYDAFLKGNTAAGLQRYDGYRTAVAYFEQAVTTQPDFAAAHVALAQAQMQFLFGGPISPRETIPKAEAAVRRALQLDDSLAQAHRTLGQILTHFYWKWDEGEKEFQRAAELGEETGGTPSAAHMSLIRTGRSAEAVAEAELTRKRDPLSFAAQVNIGTAYRAAGQYDRALAELRRALEITPGQSRAYFQIGATYLAMGRMDDAIRELETTVQSVPGWNARFEAYLGYAYAAAGRGLDARAILKSLESHRREQYVSSFGIALIHDALGEKEPALAAFERACEDHAVEFALMTQYPPFKTIASEPRFHGVMRRVGLPR